MSHKNHTGCTNDCYLILMGPKEATECSKIKFGPLSRSKGFSASPEESLSEKYDTLLEKEVSG